MADLAIKITAHDQASSVFGQVSKAASGLGSSLSGLAGAPVAAMGGLVEGLGKLGLAGMGLQTLVGGVASVATGMVAGNAEMERYETQLRTLLGGSAEAAKDRLAELAKFGAETPFELPEIAAAEKVLLGFGLTGQKAVEMTGKSATDLRTIIGDVAAGTGAGFQEIALTFGKFSAGATGEAISRLQELGVVTREQMAEMGIQFSKSGELVSPLPEAMAVAVKIAESKFGGGMKQLSATFEGQMSTLADNFNQAKIAIMAPIFDVLKDSLAGLNSFISSEGFQDWLKETAALLAGGVKSGIEIAREAFERFGPTLVEIGQKVGDAWRTVVQVFQDDWQASDQIDPLVNAVGQLAVAVRDQVLPALGQFRDLLGRLGTFLLEHKDLILAVGAAFATFQVLTTVVAAVTAFTAAWTAASAAMVASGGVIAALVAVLGGPITIAIAAIAIAVGALTLAWVNNWGDIQGKTQAAWEFLRPIFEALGQALGALVTALRDGDFQGAWDIFRRAAEEGVAAVLTKLGELRDRFLAWAGEVVPQIPGKLGEIITAIGTWVVMVAVPALDRQLDEWVAAFTRWVGGAIRDLPGALGGIITAIGTWIGSVAGSLGNLGSQIASAVWQGVSSWWTQNARLSLPSFGGGGSQSTATVTVDGTPTSSVQTGGSGFAWYGTSDIHNYLTGKGYDPYSDSYRSWFDYYIDARNSGLSAPSDMVVTGRAGGGGVRGGQMYLVGEQGPELFLSKGSGSIVPNHQLGGNSVTIQGPLIGSVEVHDEADEDRLVDKIQRCVTSLLVGSGYSAGIPARTDLAGNLV